MIPGLIVGALVLLLVATLASVTWHATNRAYRELLLARPERVRATRTALVVEASLDEVVLDQAPERSRVATSVWGVVWDGGYARISMPIAEANGHTRYSVEVLHGELSAGLRCELDPAAFPIAPPETVGMSEVEYPTPFGVYRGWFAPGAGTTWLICVHGKNAMHREMLRMVTASGRHELPTLSISYHNDDGTPLTNRGLSRFGRDEWRDLEAAVEYALAAGATEVLIAAESVGAAIALWFIHESPHRERVRGMVFDSPLLDTASAMRWVGQNSSPLPRPLVQLGMLATAHRFRFAWSDYDARPIFGELTVPVVLLHGERDGQTPIATSVDVAARYPGLVTLKRVPGAGHCQTWNADPAQYSEAFDALVEEALHASDEVTAPATTVMSR